MAYANSVDPDRMASESSLIRVNIVCHSTKYFKRELHKKAKFRLKRYGIKCSKFKDIYISLINYKFI